MKRQKFDEKVPCMYIEQAAACLFRGQQVLLNYC